ncbi:class I SAM-dependent methyltransferase [Actinacidiphila yeochonensis]|uniref:class I SAM-dependent methyltransferase n=1 Tax=Actinacidiphila yeochonensis TaxID=89050 RepID=UPI00068B3551|nr:class I SAM-dependent methyltransferase [Actinacidiphila yeochonensis]
MTGQDPAPVNVFGQDPARATVFGSAAEEYGRLRPGPCPEAVDWMAGGHHRVLDLAAGAGTLTMMLVERGHEVVAVDPDERMRAVLAARNPGVRVLEGTAERVPLPDASVDAVVVSSAWHWFDPDRARAETARVLRPGGRLAVVWNSTDNEVEWVADWRNALRDAARGQFGGPARDAAGAGDAASPSDGAGSGSNHWRRGELLRPQLDFEGSPFGDFTAEVFHCVRATTPADAAALLGTYSRLLVLPEEERRRFTALAEVALRERLGLPARDPEGAEPPVVEMPFRTLAFAATRR